MPPIKPAIFGTIDSIAFVENFVAAKILLLKGGKGATKRNLKRWCLNPGGGADKLTTYPEEKAEENQRQMICPCPG